MQLRSLVLSGLIHTESLLEHHFAKSLEKIIYSLVREMATVGVRMEDENLPIYS